MDFRSVGDTAGGSRTCYIAAYYVALWRHSFVTWNPRQSQTCPKMAKRTATSLSPSDYDLSDITWSNVFKKAQISEDDPIVKSKLLLYLCAPLLLGLE